MNNHIQIASELYFKIKPFQESIKKLVPLDYSTRAETFNSAWSSELEFLEKTYIPLENGERSLGSYPLIAKRIASLKEGLNKLKEIEA